MLIKQFTTGPTVNISQSLLEVFELFFSDDLLDIIVEESNRYVAQVMGDEHNREWNKITHEEVKAFFGFSILMGIDHLPSVDDYWSKDPLLHYAPIADRIPKDGASVSCPGTYTLSIMTISLHKETPRMIG